MGLLQQLGRIIVRSSDCALVRQTWKDVEIVAKDVS